MARSGFGGSGDFGSFFGSLYTAGRDTARAQQDADDQDAFDKWQNGLMSDQEWIQYMQGRIDAYAGDPKRQQKWVDYLRQYSTVISDNQAEFAYKNGESTVNGLIAHYQERLASMDGESTEGRNMKLRINDLMDQRAVDSIQTGAEKIQLQIEKGQASYKDLLSFLREHRVDTRANSDLRESLDKQIKSVQEQIRTNAVEGSFEKLQYDYDRGALGAGAYAARLRHMAQQFKTSDPKRYYQILEAAVALGKAGGSGGGGGGGGGRGGSHKGADGLTASERKAKNVDTAMAARNRLQALIAQYEDGAKVGIDPKTGAQVVFSPAKVKQLDRQLLSAMDGLAHAYRRKGDLSAATAVETNKAQYISSYLVKHNTLPAAEAENELMRTTQARISAALEDPDPTRAMNALRGVARDWRNFATGLTNQQSQTYEGGGRPGAPTFGDSKGPLDRVDPEFASSAQALANALTTLTTPDIDDATAEAALSGVMQLYGGSEAGSAMSKLLAPVLQVHGNEQGLASGEVARVVTGKGIEYVRTTEVSSTALVNGAVVSTKIRVPDVDTDGKTTKLVDVYVDINGSPTKVKAVAQLDTVGGFASYYAKSKVSLPDGSVIPAGWVSDEVVSRVGDAVVGQLLANGKVQLKASQAYWKVTVPGGTDEHGKLRPSETWVQDGQTNLWYKDKLPIRGVQTYDNGVVKVTANGPAIDFKSFASAAGVPAPYVGMNPKKMQLLMDDGAVDTLDVKGRDLLGNVVPEAGLSNPYWNGSTTPRPTEVGGGAGHDSWWDDEERDQRRDSEMAMYRARTGKANVNAYTGFNTDFVADPKPQDPSAQLAEHFGINLGGTKPKAFDPGAFVSSSRERAQAAAEAKLKTTKPTYSGPVNANQSGVTLDPVGPRVNASTGFTINLPKPKPKATVTAHARPKPKARKPAPKVTLKPTVKKVEAPTQAVRSATQRVAY